ncbi:MULTISPECIES: NAD(P)H-dependent oxidoreductase [unclassified Bradyrhizobium]|uniref:NAD(P)H-dependent oxidoreductase n=1 Tax=unclassified Bradyrhizobium TaxID=2631580 RepID=UPI0023051AAC|nr:MULTISPECIES: NAD(P)H-dependent oxidoreductase [unclassified Bradyrhizobium]
MRYFIVYAHPEPQSLNGQLMKNAVAGLEAAGHEVKVSDLYASRWKSAADADDFPQGAARPLSYGKASAEAFNSGTQSSDIAAEQAKLLWADAVVLQFPIWWYGMPAILKGWVDRVYARGFAYGVGTFGGSKWGERFGEGVLKGRRAMAAVTLGGRAAQYGPRGVNGSIDDILWPIQHGVLFYPGMTVVPPTVFYEVGRLDADTVTGLCRSYLDRLLRISTTDPIPFRTQNGGDYDEHQVLREHLAEGHSGLNIHQSSPPYSANTFVGATGDFTARHIAPTSRGDEH